MGVLALTAAGLSWVAVRWRRQQKGRESLHVVYQCKCKAVQATVAIDKANVDHVINAYCHCDDCQAFIERVDALKPGVGRGVIDETGVPCMCQAFKDEFVFRCGAEHVVFARLKPASPLLRLYTSCCFTPFGLTPAFGAYPMVVLYRKNFAEGAPLGPVSHRLFMRCAPPNVPQGLADAQTVDADGVSGDFLLRTIGRALYGMAAGRATPDPWLSLKASREVVDFDAPKKD